jgi:hypothetical protein
MTVRLQYCHDQTQYLAFSLGCTRKGSVYTLSDMYFIVLVPIGKVPVFKLHCSLRIIHILAYALHT